MPSPTELRKGKVINYNGSPHLVLDMMHRTQGRQAGFVQTTLRNLTSGSTTTTKFRSTDNVEILMTDSQRLEFSYFDQEGYHFLHPETFEDTVLAEDMIEDAKKYLSEGNEYDILFVDGQAIQIQLRSSVELKVTDAPEGLKGDTSGSALKPVTTATGVIVQTPLFIKSGDLIRVSTENGSYLGRA